MPNDSSDGLKGGYLVERRGVCSPSKKRGVLLGSEAFQRIRRNLVCVALCGGGFETGGGRLTVEKKINDRVRQQKEKRERRGIRGGISALWEWRGLSIIPNKEWGMTTRYD